jgi:hypothetical protein
MDAVGDHIRQEEKHNVPAKLATTSAMSKRSKWLLSSKQLKASCSKKWQLPRSSNSLLIKAEVDR